VKRDKRRIRERAMSLRSMDHRHLAVAWRVDAAAKARQRNVHSRVATKVSLETDTTTPC